MRTWTLERLWLALIVAAFLSLIPLAWLQYRWIGEVARADVERRQMHLRSAAARFAEDFDVEATRLFRSLAGGAAPPKEELAKIIAERLALFEQTGGERRMVRNVWLAEPDDTARLFRWRGAEQRFEAEPWPGRLLQISQQLLLPPPQAGVAPFVFLADGTPLLITPRWRPAPLPHASAGPVRRRVGEPAEIGYWLILELDLDFIRDQFLPRLVARNLLDAGAPDPLAVRVDAGPEGSQTIYISDPTLTAEFFRPPDVIMGLFRMRPQAAGLGLGGAMRRGGIRPRSPEPELTHDPNPPPFPHGPAWRLTVKHRAGSLQAVVAAARNRNLAISFAVLLLLAGTLAALLATISRAQRLAGLQMQFVAGVSHELRTPLSVICSAGDNLADGVVASEQQVRRYGSVIRAEGRRLAHMVEQILRFAGIQSGRARFTPEPVDTAGLLRRTVEESGPAAQEAGCRIELQLQPDLPPLFADPTSLSHAVRNLIENALLHAARGKWVGVSAARAGDAVEIAVEDHGPGLAAAELRRIFDPFYRGRRAVEDQTKGFGLGLALARRIAEAHSGSLRAQSEPGQGSKFILRLPAAQRPVVAAEAGETQRND